MNLYKYKWTFHYFLKLTAKYKQDKAINKIAIIIKILKEKSFNKKQSIKTPNIIYKKF